MKSFRLSMSTISTKQRYFNYSLSTDTQERNMRLFKEISAKLVSDGHLKRDKIDQSAASIQTNSQSSSFKDKLEALSLNRRSDEGNSKEERRKRSLSEPLQVKQEPTSAPQATNQEEKATPGDETLLMQVPSNVRVVTIKKGGRMWNFELK